ncbi:hypothetical protein AMECASPLE_027118, partial [Ameca splendens]
LVWRLGSRSQQSLEIISLSSLEVNTSARFLDHSLSDPDPKTPIRSSFPAPNIPNCKKEQEARRGRL